MAAKKKPKPKIVNCDCCGRDTTNKSRICVHCTGGVNPAFETDETRERREIAELLYGDGITRDEEIARDAMRSIEID
jgi:hypothetical protein